MGSYRRTGTLARFARRARVPRCYTQCSRVDFWPKGIALGTECRERLWPKALFTRMQRQLVEFGLRPNVMLRSGS